LSSHILNEVELVANRMVILNKGKVIVEGMVDSLLNTGDLKVTVETSNPEKLDNCVYLVVFCRINAENTF